MFIEVLFTIAKRCKQSKNPSTDEQDKYDAVYSENIIQQYKVIKY